MSAPIRVSIGATDAARTATEMVRFRFSRRLDQPVAGEVTIALEPLDPARSVELWHHPGPHQESLENGVRVIENPEYALFALDVHDAHDATLSLREQSRGAYLKLLAAIESHRCGQIIKAWNIIPDINHGEGDLERYRQFCLGRSEAFDQFGIGERAIPAGTAVGSDAGQPLQIIVLTAGNQPQPIENPRQVSAYRYPRQYGPRSPSFARAAILNGAATTQFFLSGTAAIVGHQSQSPGDPRSQAETTITNIQTLVRAAQPDSSFPFDGTLRAYIRAPEYTEHGERAGAALVGDLRSVLPIRADICRRELLLEIDGIGYLNGHQA